MFNNKRTLTTLAGAAGLALACSTAPASAYLFDFVAVEEGVQSNFAYSYWHAATGNMGMTGAIIAVFGDAPGGATTNTSIPISGTYNTVGGGVNNLTMTIFEPSTAGINSQVGVDPGNPVGTLVMNGNLGPLSDWNDNDNGELGSLSFVATFGDNTNSVYSWLTSNGFSGVDNGNGTYSVSDTFHFNDKLYGMAGAANSIAVDEGSDPILPDDNTAFMGLWGGALTTPGIRNANGGFIYTNATTTLGMDLFMELDFGGGGTSVPETTSLALFGLSLVGFGVAARRRRK